MEKPVCNHVQLLKFRHRVDDFYINFVITLTIFTFFSSTKAASIITTL
jgi:hypothetical protein